MHRGHDTFKEQVKERFIKNRGYWSDDIWNTILNLDARFMDQYLQFSSVPFKHNHLSLKEKELIYIAFDVSVTHLYTPGAKVHMENALEYGASMEEILEVIEIASILGIQSIHYGAEILDELLEDEKEKAVFNSEHIKLKEIFIEENGCWDAKWEATLKYSPRLFKAYLGMLRPSEEHRHLTPKMREFIFLTINAAVTHLNKDKMKLHIKRALELKATKEEIIEVLELTSTLSIHSATVSMPVLEKVVSSE